VRIILFVIFYKTKLVSAMLLNENNFLNDDLFELKSRFDLKCLEGLFEKGFPKFIW